MEFWKGLAIAFAIQIPLHANWGDFEQEEVYYADVDYSTYADMDYANSYTEENSEEPCCEEEYWCCEICYEPQYYTVQKWVDKQMPTKRKCCRVVPKEYMVQRVRYVPEVYMDKIVKNEIEYFEVDDIKVRSEMVSETKCEWVPKSVWKKVTKESCCK